MLTFLKVGAAGAPFDIIRTVLRMRVYFAAILMGIAVIGGLSNAFSIKLVTALHPVTALCLFGLGACIFKVRRIGRPDYWQTGVLSAIASICIARLMDVIMVGLAGGTAAALFGPIAGFDGFFDIEVALILGAFSLAALIPHSGGRIGGAFLAIGLGLVFHTFVGLTYGRSVFGTDTGAFAVLGCVSAAVAMMSVFAHRPFVRVTMLQGHWGQQTRAIAGTIIVVPWGVGFVQNGLGQVGTAGVLPYDTVMIATMTFVMMLVLLKSSAVHEHAYAARRNVEINQTLHKNVDPVTGVLNRFGMNETVDGAWLDFRGSGGQYGMILMDLQYFRNLDAAFGQGNGEAALSRLIATLKPHLRRYDALGRWGRDQFLIVLKIKDESNLDIVSSRLQHALADARQPFCAGLDAEPVSIDVPLGLSAMRMSDDSPAAALVRADHGLHGAKMKGDGRMTVQNSAEEHKFMFSEPDGPHVFVDPTQIDAKANSTDVRAA